MDIAALKAEKEAALAAMKLTLNKMDEEAKVWISKHNSDRDALMTQAVEIQGQIRMLVEMAAQTPAK